MSENFDPFNSTNARHWSSLRRLQNSPRPKGSRYIKWTLAFYIILVFSSSPSFARSICGIDVGNVPILVASEACNPKSISEFKKTIKTIGGMSQVCKINGKTILAVKTDKMTAAIDYTTVKTIVNFHCKNGCTSRYCKNNYLTN